VRPLRLDQQIVEAGADQPEIAHGAAGDEGGQPARMLDRGRHRHLGAQQPPRLGGVDRDRRVEQDRDDPGRRRQRPDQRVALAGDDHQSAEQARGDIVPGWRIRRHALAGHRERQQIGMGERTWQQRIGSNRRGDRRGGRSAHAGAHRNALFDRQADAEVGARSLEQGRRGGQGGVGRRSVWQPVDEAAHRAKPGASFRLADGGDAIADGVERLAEHVEADTDIADARRRAGRRGDHAIVHG
jgi:hypothetical protein